MSRYLLIAAFLILSGCDKVETDTYVAVGTVARPRVELVAESNDVITAIHVQEGDRITAGTPVFEQDPTLYQTKLAQLQAARDRTAARLAELVRGPRNETITATRAKLQGARANLEIQQREHERVAKLVADKLASPSLLDQIEQQRSAAKSSVDQTAAELAALESGTTAEELDQIRATLAEADAAINMQQTLLQRLQVTAPADGIIDALPFEMGERPQPGATVAVLLTGELPYARVYVPEPLRSGITTGTTASIQVDGIASPFQGRVRYVSTDAAFTPYYALTQRDRGRLSYLAEIDFIDNSTASLPSGVPVEVSFSAAPAGGQ